MTWIILVIVVALGLYDIYLAYDKVKGNTLSEIAYHMAIQHPLLPVMVGIVIGHIFWPQEVVKK